MPLVREHEASKRGNADGAALLRRWFIISRNIPAMALSSQIGGEGAGEGRRIHFPLVRPFTDLSHKGLWRQTP